MIATKEKQTAYQIHTTTDYSMFRNIDGNRKKNLQHINRLEQSIKERYLFTVITVNEKYEIIDGQHRFEVLSKLGLPINYVVCDGYGLAEVHRMNTNSKNWTADDYMNAYVDLGYEEYVAYKQFKDKYKLSHSVARALLGHWSGGNTSSFFNSGNFKAKSYEKAIQDIERIRLIKPYYDGINRRSFINAMINLFRRKNFNFNQFLAKIKLQPTALVDCPSTTAYVALIEDIYNYRRKNKVNLRY